MAGRFATRGTATTPTCARVVGHRPRRVLGQRSPRTWGVRWRRRPTAVLGRRTMPGAEWFPGGELSYPEHILAGWCPTGPTRWPWWPTARPGDPSSSPGPSCPTRWPAAPPASDGSASARVTGSGPTHRTSPRRWWPSWPPPPWAWCGRAAPPVRHPFGDRPPGPDRAHRPPGRRRLPLRHPCNIDRTAEVRAIQDRSPVPDPHLVWVPYLGDGPRGRVVRPAGRPRPGPALVRPGAVRPPPLRPVQLGHHGPAQGHRARQHGGITLEHLKKYHPPAGPRRPRTASAGSPPPVG